MLTNTEYVGFLGYCPECAGLHRPAGILKYGKSQLYEHGFKAWVIYHKVALRLSYRQIVELIRDHFNELKYQKRFTRYRGSLFTFLEENGVPWHNNTAETAIRHLAMFRDMSKSLYESGVRNYLVMLGIRQTCRFQGKSFLKFLFSREKDIDQFKERKR